MWPARVRPLVGTAEGSGASGEDRCPKCGKPVGHYEDREVRVRWCGYPEAHYWDWQLKVPKLTMRP
jgi:hypothetical protein